MRLLLSAGWGQDFKVQAVSFFMKVLRFALIGLSLFSLLGCAYVGPQSSLSGEVFVVNENSKFLPSEGVYGRFEVIQKGTQLNLLKKGWGFSLVKLADGRTGEVSSESLAVDPRGWLSPVAEVSEVVSRGGETDSVDGGFQLSDYPSNSGGVSEFIPVEPELPTW